MATVKLEHINKSFGHDTSLIKVLKDVNFSATAGNLCLVSGPSGSGKSTFLTIAGGLQTPTSGTVILNDQEINDMPAKKRDSIRLNSVGFILQSYSLVPYLTVMEQFKFVDRIKKDGNLTEEELMSLLDELGIKHLINKFPNELSGGQMQRVAIARALYTKPQIIFADEPTASLDSKNGKIVVELLKRLAKEDNRTVILVSHDPRMEDYADEIYRIMDGKMHRD